MQRAAGNLRSTASLVLNKTRDACLEKVEQTYRIAKEALAHTIRGSGLANASCNEWEGEVLTWRYWSSPSLIT